MAGLGRGEERPSLGDKLVTEKMIGCEQVREIHT